MPVRPASSASGPPTSEARHRRRTARASPRDPGPGPTKPPHPPSPHQTAIRWHLEAQVTPSPTQPLLLPPPSPPHPPHPLPPHPRYPNTVGSGLAQSDPPANPRARQGARWKTQAQPPSPSPTPQQQPQHPPSGHHRTPACRWPNVRQSLDRNFDHRSGQSFDHHVDQRFDQCPGRRHQGIAQLLARRLDQQLDWCLTTGCRRSGRWAWTFRYPQPRATGRQPPPASRAFRAPAGGQPPPLRGPDQACCVGHARLRMALTGGCPAPGRGGRWGSFPLPRERAHMCVCVSTRCFTGELFSRSAQIRTRHPPYRQSNWNLSLQCKA